jgi:hypothetical protein
MRASVKGNLAILAVYVAILAIAAAWLEHELRSLSRTMIEGTARLVGQETRPPVRGSPRSSRTSVAARRSLHRLQSSMPLERSWRAIRSSLAGSSPFRS